MNKISVFASYLIRFKLNSQQTLPKYFFFYGQSPFYKNYINETLRIVAQPNINAKELARLEIPLPPLSEQRETVDYLDQMQNEVEKLRRLQGETQKEIEALTSSILHQAFRGEL